jgi:hypothetical protein
MGLTGSIHGRDEKCIQNLVGKPEGKRPLGGPRCIWENNSRMDVREMGWEGVNWIQLARDRDLWRAVVNMVMNLRVP